MALRCWTMLSMTTLQLLAKEFADLYCVCLYSSTGHESATACLGSPQHASRFKVPCGLALLDGSLEDDAARPCKTKCSPIQRVPVAPLGMRELLLFQRVHSTLAAS